MSMLHEITDEEPGLGSWAILHGYRGSVAHGMYEPPENPLSIDDKDTMAICVPSLDYYYGLLEYGSRGTREIKRGEWDVVIYEARKAVRMLAQGNPNILSLLWLP
jgi:predicted nucleotidyltransferase